MTIGNIKIHWNFSEYKHFMLAKLLLLFCIIIFPSSIYAITHNVGTEAEYNTAYTASTGGDVINITNNIVVTSMKTIAKTVTIEGNGFSISVLNTGLDAMGLFNASASAFRVFTISPGVSVTINNLTIKGGALTSGYGGAISVSATCSLKLNNCIVSNSRNTSSGGGAIGNSGVLYLNNSCITRNAATYGGGILNLAGGVIYIENSTISENRSTSTSAGGGAIENRATLYINNSCISNNQSTEIGGAINNYLGTIYMANSSVTGNVAYGSYKGGGIGNNGGTVRAVNSIFAYNYHIIAGSVSNPTAFELDDIVAQNGQTGVYLHYCVYHANLPSGTNNVIGNIQYAGLLDGSNNSIFSGGLLSNITDGTGFEIGTAKVFRPFLYKKNGVLAVTLKSGSFLLNSANKGTQTRFANNNNSSPTVAYYNQTTSSWINLVGTSTANQLVSTDQANTTRANSPAIGAIESTSDNLFMVKTPATSNGSVIGASIFGEVYTSGSQVSITGVPLSNNSLIRWNFVTGGTGTASTTNPYSFTVDRNIVLAPVFGVVTLSVSTATATLDKIANSSTLISVTSNTIWTASSDQSWLRATATDNGTLTLTAISANTATTTRSATVTVSANGATSKTIAVTQTASDPNFSVSATKVSIDPIAENTARIQVTSNVNWVATSSLDWLTVSGSGTGNGTLTISATNTTEPTREGTVTISAAGLPDQTITVTQNWGFNVSKYQLSMTVTSIATIDSKEVTNTDLQITAFIGDECRGVGTLKYVPSYNRYIAYLMIWGGSMDANKLITFKSYNSIANKQFGAVNGSLAFIPDKRMGTSSNPYIINFVETFSNVENLKEMSLNIYPNPATDAFCIDGLNETSTITLTDLSGSVLLQKCVVANEYIHVGNLPRGVCIVKVSNSNGVFERKLIIK